MSDIKATIAQLQSQLESVHLSRSAVRVQLKDIRRDLDYPHNCKSLLESCLNTIARCEKELQNQQLQKVAYERRLDTEFMNRRYTELCEELEKLDAQIKTLSDKLAETNADKTVLVEAKDELKTVRKLFAGKSHEDILQMLQDLGVTPKTEGDVDAITREAD